MTTESKPMLKVGDRVEVVSCYYRQHRFVEDQGVIDKDFGDNSFKVQLDDGSFHWFYGYELEVI